MGSIIKTITFYDRPFWREKGKVLIRLFATASFCEEISIMKLSLATDFVAYKLTYLVWYFKISPRCPFSNNSVISNPLKDYW